MNILAIDTSTSHAGIALRCRGESWTRAWTSEHNHGRELMPRIQELLESGGCAMSDLDCVAVALGPGGFSAVRVGVSCALGIACPQQIRTIGIPTHYLQAYSYATSDACNTTAGSVVSLIPIGRHQLSAARYALPLGDIRASSQVKIVSAADFASRLEREAMAVCGEGLLAIDESGDAEEQFDPRPPESMLDIAEDATRQGVDAYWPIHPIYAREPTITQPRPRG